MKKELKRKSKVIMHAGVKSGGQFLKKKYTGSIVIEDLRPKYPFKEIEEALDFQLKQLRFDLLEKIKKHKVLQ